MRSIKTMLLLAIAAMALAVPASASAAQWTESGTPITEPLQWTNGGSTLTGEQSISLEGPMKLTHAATGGVECTMTAAGILVAGTEGVFYENSINPASCKLNGLLKTTCSKVTSATVSNWWPVEAVEKTAGVRTMAITLGKITYNMQPIEGNPNCPAQFETSGGTITATPDNAKSISSVSLSGTVPHVGLPANLIVSGALPVKPAAKFGINRQENIVTLSGGIKWSNAAFGGIECSASGSLTLRPGEKGEITALSFPGECVLSGARKTECGTAKIVAKELPWAVSLTASKTINITKFPFEVQFGNGCKAWTFSGAMLATPNNTSAIASTTLGGTLSSPQIGAQTWTGSLSWTPSGKYGIS